MPTSFAPILRVLITELTNAARSGNEMQEAMVGVVGGSSPPPQPADRPYYFELVKQLNEELESRGRENTQALKKIESSHSIELLHVAEAGRLREQVEQLTEALDASREHGAELAALLARAQKDLSLLGDEKDALEQRVTRREEEIREMAEASKEMQVTLFVEQRRSVEQQQLYKELRQAKELAASVASTELRVYQRALLRAHQASLMGSGMRAVLHGLTEQPLPEQFTHALRWADDLPAARCEPQLMRSGAGSPVRSAAGSPSRATGA